MENKLQFRLATFLYKHSFPLYKNLYSRFKQKQDEHEISFLKSQIKKGDVVLDIGSNIGFYTKIMSELAGEKGKVHSFEPDKINFKHLKNSVGSLPNVVLNNKAVSDKTGKLEIFTSHRLNVDHRTYKPEKYESSYFIDAIALDDYLKENTRVDFIKMDIQGAEMFALKGMKKILTENKNVKVLTELWPHGLRSAGTSVMEMLKFIADLGFKSFMIGADAKELNSENVKLLKDAEGDYYNVIITK